MKKFLFILILINSIHTYCQEIKISGYKNLNGICNPENVEARFSIFTYTSQTKFKIKKIENELNSRLKLLTTYLNLSEDRMINIVLNCKGDVLKSEIDAKKIDHNIKNEIENTFKMLTIWKKRKYNGGTDSSILISFKIENGMISLK
ncbi:MAG: hypothetical protein KDD26_09350 [Winogradskyella sp.]|nr:hypothetical protein [Winogradskyella sp.]